MNKICIGIDISMNEFHACIKVRSVDGSVKIKATRTFKNTLKGHQEFFEWSLKVNESKVPVWYVMEATGVYFENLAYFLYKKSQQVSVVLANKIKNYTKSLNIKTKTDKVDSIQIAGYGIERELDLWK